MMLDRDSFAAAVVDGVLHVVGGRQAQPTGHAIAFVPSVEVFAAGDTTAPLIASVVATPGVLWPPNHQMIPVRVQVEASDDTDPAPACRIAGIASSEPSNGVGDGDTDADWRITGALTAELRAERTGQGAGREYTLEVVCGDQAGNQSAPAATVVRVPHGRGK
jgi:hypothetical protein